jgi:hypothetical protein
MPGTTLYNRTNVQKSVKAKDGKTYWISPKKHTTIPAPVDNYSLPRGVKIRQSASAVLTTQPPNK